MNKAKERLQKQPKASMHEVLNYFSELTEREILEIEPYKLGVLVAKYSLEKITKEPDNKVS